MPNYLPQEAREPAARRVLHFWFGEPPEYGSRRRQWFDKDAGFDGSCRRLFLGVYEQLVGAEETLWLDHRAECRARIIVLDQFPRNMFRGTARAFAADALALQAARRAVDAGYDRSLLPVERMFMYLPFEHSEALQDQLRACELIAPLEAFAETADSYRYAVAHRDIIQRFGRFPHRNAALGRDSTPEETVFLTQPGSSF
jgi:uncharacterized protein (DUF924 family)